MERRMVITGMILILLAILLGAFGAHGLQTLLKNDPALLKEDVLKRIASFETGVKYQMYSGITFLILGFNASRFSFSLKMVFQTWLLGTILFSGSIYLLSIQSILGMSVKFLGPVTPIGGLLLIVGWCVILVKFIRQKN